MRSRVCPVLFAWVVVSCDEPAVADSAPRSPSGPVPAAQVTTGDRVESGRIYLPVYSHIYIRSAETEDLAVTVSVHNVSIKQPIVLESARYYDTGGKLLEEFVNEAAILQPLETVEFFVPTDDGRGGSGANIVVTWGADAPVVAPLVEAVMVQSVKTNRAFAFSTRGVEISRDAALPDEAAQLRPKETVVELPDAAATAGSRIAIALSPSGITVAGESSEPSGLLEKMNALAADTPDATVTIEADDAVPHSRLVEVLDIVEQAGFESIAIATRSND